MTNPQLTTLSCMKAVKRDGSYRPSPDHPPALILTAYVGDRSGSTISFGGAQYAGFRKFVKDRIKDAENSGARALFSFTTFDNTARTWHHWIDLKDLDPNFTDRQIKEWMEPRGTTRLVDTLHECLVDFKCKLLEEDERLEKSPSLSKKISAVFACMTDGLDNESCEHTELETNMLVKELRSMGVTCMFLGANQDAIVAGGRLGFAQDTSLTIGSDAATAACAFRSLTAATQRVVSGDEAPAFTPLERSISGPGGFKQPHSAPMVATNFPNAPPVLRRMGQQYPPGGGLGQVQRAGHYRSLCRSVAANASFANNGRPVTQQGVGLGVIPPVLSRQQTVRFPPINHSLVSSAPEKEEPEKEA
jgi:hypothetical protein